MMRLIGLDVGFSRSRPTSGIAYLGDEGLTVCHATANWADRQRALGTIRDVDVTAIDAPLVPEGHTRHREVERALSRGCFQRRCKPGASHVRGTGLELRRAGRDTAEQLASLTSERPLVRDFPRVWGKRNLVEAFPNAFLGVCIDDLAYRMMPKLRRGRKFDWLYDEWCRSGLFREVASFLGLDDGVLAQACKLNSHHEQRAALICLLTAASVARGKFVAVGEPDGGYIFLPPFAFWAGWAREEVERQRELIRGLQVWADGSSFE
jgi:predicted nuclease with RNAse H fold